MRFPGDISSSDICYSIERVLIKSGVPVQTVAIQTQTPDPFDDPRVRVRTKQGMIFEAILKRPTSESWLKCVGDCVAALTQIYRDAISGNASRAIAERRELVKEEAPRGRRFPVE